jgi:hypothetical protein
MGGARPQRVDHFDQPRDDEVGTALGLRWCDAPLEESAVIRDQPGLDVGPAEVDADHVCLGRRAHRRDYTPPGTGRQSSGRPKKQIVLRRI